MPGVPGLRPSGVSASGGDPHRENPATTAYEGLPGDPVKKQEEAIQRLARDHYLPFVKVMYPRYETNPVARLVARELEWFEAEVVAGRSPRLILEMPPRVGKSELVSRKYPGWLLGRHPEWNIGLISYGADLAERLSRDARRVVMSDEYMRVFTKYETEEVESVEIDKTSKSVNYWRIAPSRDNPQPGGLQAAGINGPVTGSGFNVLLFDDPHKNWEEANSRAAKDRVWNYYIGTLYDRLEPGAGILVVMQRWAVDDLVGRLLAVDDTDEEGFDIEYLDQWKVIRLPAQAEAGEEDALGREPGEWLPARYTAAQWERAKANNLKKNPRIWHAKFQQRPAPPEGSIFQPNEWIRFEDDPENDGPVFLMGDTSYGKGRNSDFSVFGVWRVERRPRLTLRLLDLYRRRAPYPVLKKDLIDLCVQWGVFVSDVSRPWGGVPRVFLEDYGSGTSLIQEFKNPVTHPRFGRIRLPIQAWHPQRDGDKDARAHAASGIMAQGLVAMPKHAPWLGHLLQTLREYQGEGTVEFDDEVDMISMSLILLGVQRPAERPSGLTHVPFEVVA